MIARVDFEKHPSVKSVHYFWVLAFTFCAGLLSVTLFILALFFL